MLYDGAWYVPKDYVRTLPVHRFSKVIFVDRTDQNIATLEKMGTVWYVRSMNPATTGLHNPPYQQETPLGVYVIQEHKPKMYYLRDGSRNCRFRAVGQPLHPRRIHSRRSAQQSESD